MAKTHLAPDSCPVRSPVYRRTRDAGALFEPLAGGALARSYGDVDAEHRRALVLGIADLSVLPRIGFKGRGTIGWLTAAGLALPDVPNRAVRQPDGVLAARLSAAEILLLGDLAGASATPGRLAAAWASATQTPRGYPLPRSDSHAWFRITGQAAPAMFAKLCAVDLRTERFADGAVAQTSVARLNGIVIRDDCGPVAGYHVLADWASADSLLPSLLDAATEFGGGLVGHDALIAVTALTGPVAPMAR